MISDQMRRLLAGYATKSLTDDERKALFQASLENQEIFDALHQEQALKDLLDDPASRAEVRAALERGAADPPPAWWTRWWTHWWTWTGAAAAVAASVIVLTVVRSRPPDLSSQVAALRAPSHSDAQTPLAQPKTADSLSSQRESQSSPPAQGKPQVQRNERASTPSKLAEPAPSVAFAPPPSVSEPSAPPPQPETAAPAAPPQAKPAAPAAAVRSALQTDAATTQQAENQARRDRNQSAEVQTLSTAAQAVLVSPGVSPVVYTIVRQNPSGDYQQLSSGAQLISGDEVRLNVTPSAAGFLTLSRRDVSGEWTRIYPASGPGLSVTANAKYVVPDAPLRIEEGGQWFRLTLFSPQHAAVAGSAFGQSERQKAKLANSLKKESPQNPAPLSVDLLLAPSKIP